MSRFIELYQERQAKRWQLKKIKKRANPEDYWKMKGEIDGITLIMDEIIKKENGRQEPRGSACAI
jgi:hypothetical protein